MRRSAVLPAMAFVTGFALPAQAETVTYTYDAQGRLVSAQHVGGRNDGVTAAQQYDLADNRVAASVIGQSKPRIVVIPLNGLTIIPVR